MKPLLEEKERDVIPRWRDFATTVALGEASPLQAGHNEIRGEAESFLRKQQAWLAGRTRSFASDLVSAAIVLGHEAEIRDAAEFLSNSPLAPELAMRVSRALISEKDDTSQEHLEASVPEIDESAVAARIRRLKGEVRNDPRNAFAWTDLALQYATLGLGRRASELVTIALSLAGDNRFIIRAAVRLFVHLEDLERAHATARGAAILREDPWIMAAEIATANARGVSSRFVRVARQMLDSRKFKKFHLAELASALGTLEFKGGNARAARRLLRASLADPTENAVAQAGWVSRRMSGLSLGERELGTARSFEARAWSYYGGAEWWRACDEAVLWLRDQPFSSRPATLGSYLAAVALDDQPRAESLAKRGLLANPRDFALLNNLAVSLALQGRPGNASEVIARIDRSAISSEEEVVLNATLGLVALRAGKVAAGLEAYHRALSQARQLTDKRYRARGATHFAAELIRLDHPLAPEAHREAETLIENLVQPERELLTIVLNRASPHRATRKPRPRGLNGGNAAPGGI